LNRRKFISQTAMSASGFALLPLWLSSCKKEMLFSNSSFKGKVIVIGAGAAGMYAAYLLHQQGINVQVLEASDRYGGRIKSLQGFSDFEIELGAEEIHGERSLWYDMVRHSGAQLITEELNELYYFNGTVKTYAQATENTFFNKVLEVMDSFRSYAGNDISAEAYGNISGINAAVQHLYNGMVGNEMGSGNAEVGMYGLREIEEKWASGKIDSRIKYRSLLSVLEQTFVDVLDKIILNSPVAALDYTASKITVTSSNGQLYEADKVIVTVPLTVLRSNEISFTPALSAERMNAFDRIGMDRGIKIILKFTERFWPSSTSYIYSEGNVPIYWATGAGGRSASDNLLTAFVCGTRADFVASQGEGMIPIILSELDALFGDATLNYVTHHIQDWGEEDFIHGAYSYSKPGTGNAREIIAKNIDSKVYFAGEATHTGGHFATVHGAMETALLAVHEILEAVS